MEKSYKMQQIYSIFKVGNKNRMCYQKSKGGRLNLSRHKRPPSHLKTFRQNAMWFFMLVYIRNSLNIVRRWNSNLSRCELSTTQWGQKPFWIRFLNLIHSWTWFYCTAKIIRDRSLISLIKPKFEDQFFVDLRVL